MRWNLNWNFIISSVVDIIQLCYSFFFTHFFSFHWSLLIIFSFPVAMKTLFNIKLEQSYHTSDKQIINFSNDFLLFFSFSLPRAHSNFILNLSFGLQFKKKKLTVAVLICLQQQCFRNLKAEPLHHKIQ